MKVLLINPPAENAARMPVSTAYAHATFVPPLGLMYLAASLKAAGIEAEIIDGLAPGFDDKLLAETLKSFAPDIVGISAYTFVFYDILETAKTVRRVRPEAKIVLGGPHIDIYPEATLTHPEFDYLIAGEGEGALVELVRAIENKKPLDKIEGLWRRDENGAPVFHGVRAGVADLDRLPFPDRDGLMRDYYHCAFNEDGFEVGMVTSRGCPFRCRYCNVLDRRFRARSPENVVAEFESLSRAGYCYVHLYDDTFNLQLDRAKEICRLLAEKKLPIQYSARLRGDIADEEFFDLLVKSGCERVNIGVESANPEILEAMDKRIDLVKVRRSFEMARRKGLRVVAFYMLGFPGETEAQARRTIDLALELKSDYAQFLPVMPFPGTPLYKDALDSGGIDDFYLEQTLHPRPDFQLELWETEIPFDRLVGLVRTAYRRFYFTPRFIARELRGLTSFRQLRDRAGIGLRLLSYQLGKTWQ